MRAIQVWRILALVIGIVGCLGLALGACMSKRAETKGPPPRSLGIDAQPTPRRNILNEKGSGADAGTATESPAPKSRMARSRSNKGMLGQMHLKGGE